MTMKRLFVAMPYGVRKAPLDYEEPDKTCVIRSASASSQRSSMTAASCGGNPISRNTLPLLRMMHLLGLFIVSLRSACIASPCLRPLPNSLRAFSSPAFWKRLENVLLFSALPPGRRLFHHSQDIRSIPGPQLCTSYLVLYLSNYDALS